MCLFDITEEMNTATTARLEIETLEVYIYGGCYISG